jgi:dihydroorotate dehydrogenase electron transfer subunit
MATESAERTVIQTMAPVISNEEVIANHKVLVCHEPQLARMAMPGHFVNVFASGTIDSILRKPFSIFQADLKTGDIAILYQVRGATTIGMSRKLPGDMIDIVGPLGGRVFHADPAIESTHVMVGGGYGVPPLVFLAERIKQANPQARIKFLIGARSRDLLLCEAELAGLSVEAHMATEDGSHGVKGRVTDVLATIMAPNTPLHVYTCGPTPMMRAVADMCVAASVPCQVSLEVPMPCGIGVCMGCVVDTARTRRVRACTDGPVFEAAEVVW